VYSVALFLNRISQQFDSSHLAADCGPTTSTHVTKQNNLALPSTETVAVTGTSCDARARTQGLAA